MTEWVLKDDLKRWSINVKKSFFISSKKLNLLLMNFIQLKLIKKLFKTFKN